MKIKNNQIYAKKCAQLEDILHGHDMDECMAPGMSSGISNTKQDLISQLESDIHEYQMKIGHHCGFCKTPWVRGAGCLECSDMDPSDFE